MAVSGANRPSIGTYHALCSRSFTTRRCNSTMSRCPIRFREFPLWCQKLQIRSHSGGKTGRELRVRVDQGVFSPSPDPTVHESSSELGPFIGMEVAPCPIARLLRMTYVFRRFSVRVRCEGENGRVNEVTDAHEKRRDGSERHILALDRPRGSETKRPQAERRLRRHPRSGPAVRLFGRYGRVRADFERMSQVSGSTM